MLKEIGKSTVLLASFTLICGLAYPTLITLTADVAFKSQADGSLVYNGQKPIASTLIAQNFSKAEYFHPRPSAAGDKGYDGVSSGGTNFGYTSQKLYDSVKEKAAKYREENGLDAKEKVPMDAVTSSASGLDPHISVENAKIQAERVAKARSLTSVQVDKVLKDSIEGRIFGFLGEEKVNVVKLNISLDRDFGTAKI
jgi:potassium-transporting ATPase KdpC subunit